MIPEPMIMTSTCVGKAVLLCAGKFIGGTVQYGSVGLSTGEPGERFTRFRRVEYSPFSSPRVAIANLNLESSWPMWTRLTYQADRSAGEMSALFVRVCENQEAARRGHGSSDGGG